MIVTFKPFRLRKIERYAGSSPTILDVGCGNGSPKITKKFFPGCFYVGIEKQDHRAFGTTPNDAEGISFVDHHVYADLEERPDVREFGLRFGTFDAIIASHVLEHFTEQTARYYLRALPLFLKPGGVLYVEVPNERTLGYRFLESNYDGVEHRALLGLGMIVNELLPTSEILEAGTRRDWVNALRSPVTLPIKLILGKKYPTELVDLLGLATYIISKRRTK